MVARLDRELQCELGRRHAAWEPLQALSASQSLPNLFDSHPPFTLSNFGRDRR